MKSQDLRDIIEPLQVEAVRRLAGRLGIEGVTRPILLQTIAQRYCRRPEMVFDEMRRDDLYRCLMEWSGSNEEVGDFCLGGLSGAKVAELHAAARLCCIEGWAPSRDGEPIARGSSITGILLSESESESEEEESDEFAPEEEPEGERVEDVDSDSESLSGLPAFEVLSTQGDEHLDEAGRGLAPFQEAAVSALQRRLERGHRALLCLPTGGGKTRTALHFLFSRYIAAGKKVLWVTHRLDLLDQVHEEIRESVWQIARRRSHLRISRVHGGAYDPRGDFVLASAMTLARNDAMLAKLNRDPGLAVIVYDEAHRMTAPATWKAIDRLLQHHDRDLLALTATPYRKSPEETETFRRIIGPPAYFKSFGDLIKTGFLARPVFMRQAMRSTESMQLSAADIAESRRDGELSSAILSALARNRSRDEEIVAHWCSNQHRYGKTIAFACDIDHADQLARTFRRHDVSSDALHSRRTGEDRRRILDAFKRGKTQVLVNVGILTEGANVPDTKTVLLGRPTLSLSLYMQMIGRGARGPFTVQGKTEFFVIDCVDNFGRHGLVTAGAQAAAELDEAIRESERAERGTPAVDATPPAAETPRVPVTVNRSVHAAAALRLLSRGYAPSAYTLWGDVRWRVESGVDTWNAAAVFVETRGMLEAAIQRLRLAHETGSYERMDAEGVDLDRLCAFRRIDWDAMVASCRSNGELPLMVEATGPIAAADLEVAARVDSLVRTQAGWGLGEWTAFLQADAAWRDYLGAVFGELGTCAWVLAQAADDVRAATLVVAAPPAESAGARDFDRDAADFSTIAYAVSWSDSTLDERESRVIDVASGLLFGRDPTRPQSAEAIGEGAVVAAAARLGNGITSERGAEEMDHLIRVVLADGRVDDRERAILAVVAPYLGVPPEVIADRLAEVGASAPSDEGVDGQRVNSGMVTCRVCSAVWPDGSRFCGECGSGLVAPQATPAESVDAEREVMSGGEGASAGAQPRDTSSGYAAEDWLEQLLIGRFGEAAVSRSRGGPGEAKTDFVVRASSGGRGSEYHIELKHAARREGPIHWSQKQVDLALRIPAVGHRYSLVVAHPREDEAYALHWCDEPRDVLRRARTKVELTYGFEHVPEVSDEHWRVEGRHVPAGAQPTVGYVVTLTEDCYREMRRVAESESPIQPVIEWWEKVHTLRLEQG